MQLVYLEFECLDGLKKFRKVLSMKKVYILLNQKVLVAEFTQKEIELATNNYEAQVVNMHSA